MENSDEMFSESKTLASFIDIASEADRKRLSYLIHLDVERDRQDRIRGSLRRDTCFRLQFYFYCTPVQRIPASCTKWYQLDTKIVMINDFSDPTVYPFRFAMSPSGSLSKDLFFEFPRGTFVEMIYCPKHVSNFIKALKLLTYGQTVRLVHHTRDESINFCILSRCDSTIGGLLNVEEISNLLHGGGECMEGVVEENVETISIEEMRKLLQV